MSNWRSILRSQCSENPPRLSVEDAVSLYDSADINELMHAAMLRRRSQVPGNEVTYLVDRNVNYTNVCTINCQFCSFYRPPEHSESYTQSIDEISERLSELEAIGGSRVLMQGGVHPELKLEWYIDLLSELSTRHPSIDFDCFSPIEIEGISQVCGLPTKDVLIHLKEAGMHGLPGGGAEMLVDEVRLDVSPKKGTAENWLNVMREAQELELTTSATNVFGFGESNLHRVLHMDSVRSMQDDAVSNGRVGFTSFVPWPVILGGNNSFGSRNRGQNRLTLGAGPAEYLRHVAISRLFFDNVLHIQASWPTMGFEVAQIALLAGADDAGSTMMEENVVSASGTTETEASVEKLQRMILRAGFRPRRRDSDYELLDTEVLHEELPTPVPLQPEF